MIYSHNFIGYSFHPRRGYDTLPGLLEGIYDNITKEVKEE